MPKWGPTSYRRWAARTAAVLIFAGLGIFLIDAVFFARWPLRPQLVWVRIPFHEWRFRLMTDETDAICLRVYCGFWFDLSFHPTHLPSEGLLVGDVLLITLIPGYLRDYVASRRLRHGFCRECRYDLTGNVTGVCPECGTPIETVSNDTTA